MPQSLDNAFSSFALTDEPVLQTARVSPKPQVPVHTLAEKWIANFNEAITSRDSSAVAALFEEDAWWKDILSLSWEFNTYHAASAIQEKVQERNNEKLGLSNFRLDPTKTVISMTPAPALGECVFAYILFDTKLGRGKGLVNLRAADDNGQEWKAYTLYTSLQKLKGHEERIGGKRPTGFEKGGRGTWLDYRSKLENMDGIDPTVLVIGSGHSGLNIAARLGMLDITTLIIERNERVGDNWRKRYKSLVLHDPVWFDHLSYMPFPPNWPVFTPKDKLGDWFESYVKAMELNVWTSTTIQGTPTFDETTHIWTITLKRGDWIRTLHPKHIILASGSSGEPNIPNFPGAESFKGDLHHSCQHPGGRKYRGKRAVVIGCCNSGHDIARDLYDHGAASVTMVQRSSTYVMSQSNGLRRIAGLYTEDGPPTEDADIFASGIPFPVLKIIQQDATFHLAREDHEILSKLKSAGFKLDYGYDGSGLFIKFLLQGGGYYIDVGCSGLIGEGKIRIKQGQGVKQIVENGVIFEDGTELEAEVIVLATGYKNMRETARKIFGDVVADQVTDVWGINEKNEIATMWQKTGQEGLWFMGGNLAYGRIYSRFLALQIKAVELGLAT